MPGHTPHNMDDEFFSAPGSTDDSNPSCLPRQSSFGHHARHYDTSRSSKIRRIVALTKRPNCLALHSKLASSSPRKMPEALNSIKKPYASLSQPLQELRACMTLALATLVPVVFFIVSSWMEAFKPSWSCPRKTKQQTLRTRRSHR